MCSSNVDNKESCRVREELTVWAMPKHREGYQAKESLTDGRGSSAGSFSTGVSDDVEETDLGGDCSPVSSMLVWHAGSPGLMPSTA